MNSKRTTWLSLICQSICRQRTMDCKILGLLMQCLVHTDVFPPKDSSWEEFRYHAILRIPSLEISVKARFFLPCGLLLGNQSSSDLCNLLEELKEKKGENKICIHSKWQKICLILPQKSLKDKVITRWGRGQGRELNIGIQPPHSKHPGDVVDDKCPCSPLWTSVPSYVRWTWFLAHREDKGQCFVEVLCSRKAVGYL